MKRTKCILTVELFSSIAVSLAIVTLFETGLLLPGSLTGNTNAEFLTVSCMEIVTICMIPLSLRLFKFTRINKRLKADGHEALTKWGSLRMAMLCVPMMINTLMYYLFGLNVAFGYMGIICLVCLPFIYPSASRCVNEAGREA